MINREENGSEKDTENGEVNSRLENKQNLIKHIGTNEQLTAYIPREEQKAGAESSSTESK